MSKRKLLLADDSMTIQKVVNLTFADEGIEVFTVGNGSLAIEKLSEIKPDLVLADVHMPGLNGYEVCEQIRMNPQFQDVPVMLLVGSFEPFDEHEAQRVGANDFLTKPFQSIRQLIQKVTALLDDPKRGTGDQTATSSFAASSNETSQENLVPNLQEDFYVEAPTSSQNDLTAASGNDFNDTTFDDEMIETSSVSNFDTELSAAAAAPPLNQASEREESFNENEMTLEAEEPSAHETAVNYEIAETDAASLEMRPTEPLSFDDIQDINSVMLAPTQTEKPVDEWQIFEAENFAAVNETSLINNSNQTTDSLQDAPVTDWEQQVSVDNADEEFEVELDLPSSEEQDFSNTDFELVNDEETYQSKDASQVEYSDFSSAVTGQPIENYAGDEPLELDLADADLLEIDDEDLILDLDDEEAVDEISAVEFDVLPVAQEAVGRQNFNESSNKVLTQVSNQAIANLNLGFPPEVIEAIAQLVIERLSDKVIEKIAWEIVPDRFDLIVRQQMDQRNR